MNTNDQKNGISFRRKITLFLKNFPIIGNIFKIHKKVAVIRFSGVIADQGRKGSISYNKYAPLIEKAFKIPDVDAVALIINSPGGSPSQCSLISTMIRELSEEKKIPVSAFVEDVAASGGYWLACSADKIFVQPSSILGSIGVISALFGFDKAIQRYDVERRVYTSGEHKSFLDPFQPEDIDSVKRLRKMQKDIHINFIDWVKTRRAENLIKPDKEIFEAQVFVGSNAIQIGLADAFGNVWSTMRELYGKDVRLIKIEPDKSFFQSLLGGVVKFPEADDFVASLENRIQWSRWGL